MRSLFEYVRAGELDLAIDMCRQSDQSWRAASLSGGKLWWDPVLAPGEDGYGDDMDMDMGGAEEKRAKGNVNRRMWKLMCRKLAAAVSQDWTEREQGAQGADVGFMLQPSLDPYERALYGAISGDTASVLPVCTSWEDHVWTHVNALFEANVEAGLWSSSEGRFWNRGADKSVKANGVELDAEDALLGSAGRGATVRNELEGIFNRLLRLEKGDLALAAKNPFHVSQTYLIVGKINDLFTTFVDRLEQSAMETEPESVLFSPPFELVGLIDVAQDPRALATILCPPHPRPAPPPPTATRVCCEPHLGSLHQRARGEQPGALVALAQPSLANAPSLQDENLIAFYASNLESASAIESYARFLLSASLWNGSALIPLTSVFRSVRPRL